MARKTFGEQFADARGRPIRFHGAEVHSIHDMLISVPTVLLVRFISASPAVRQALRLAVDGGRMVVNGQELNEVVLWADTAPRRVSLQVAPTAPRGGAVLKIWNAWEDETGAMQAWLGDCGMKIEDAASGVTLRCSDGLGGPDFNDLVVQVARE